MLGLGSRFTQAGSASAVESSARPLYWQLATVGFACVSNSARHAQEMVDAVADFIEDTVRADAEVLDVETEVLTGFF